MLDDELHRKYSASGEPPTSGPIRHTEDELTC